MRTVMIVFAALLIAGCGGSTGGSYKPKESDVGANTAGEERTEEMRCRFEGDEN